MPYIFANIFFTIDHLLILFMCFPRAAVCYLHVPQLKMYENVVFVWVHQHGVRPTPRFYMCK